MPYPLPLTRTEAYLAYKAGVIQQSGLKPSLAVPRNGIDAWLAYWTGIAEDYPKREDGTPHILQEEEAYIAYLSGVINEYPEKCLRRVGAYLRYLISARWGRPDHPLNREELYLSLIKTQFIPSGDPSSDIVIDGTAKAPFVDVKMYGDTFQQNYDGKNLWGGFASDFSKTSSGVTFVNKADGTITANGTATGTALSLFSTDAISRNRLITLSAGDYIISGATDVVRLEVINTSGGVVADTSGSISGVRAFSISEQTQVAVRAKMANTYVADNVIIKPMLEAGSTASDYEPFVGGKPSPNPEYPQPIRTVTGEQTVEIVGKNLFDKDDVVNGIPSASDGTIVSTTSIGRASGFIRVKSSTNYSHTGHPNGWATIAWYKENKSFISRTDNATTTTSPTEAAFARVSCASTDLNTCQFEEGQPTDYVPYSKQTLPLDLGDIQLCGLGDDGNGNPLYKDYIYPDGEEWKIHKAIGKYVYGDDLAQNGISETMVSMITPTLPVIRNLAHDSGICQSNMYTPIDQNGTGLSGTTGTNRIRIYTAISIANSYNAVRQLASANNLTIYYPLDTATDTVITDQTLIAQLEALVKGGSEDGTTYIKVSATEPNLPAKLYVEAPKYD